MYTLPEAEYLRDYYWNMIINQPIGTGDTFKDIKVVQSRNGFEVWCFITSSAYLTLQITSEKLDLISPVEVLKNRAEKE